MSSAPSPAEVNYNLLKQLWGSQIDFSEVGSYVESKLYAVARLLAQVQGELEHAGNQANPLKAYEQIPLLELDYQIAPPANADYVSRQRALAAAMAFSQGEIASNVVHELQLVLGAKFLAYVPNPAGTPTVYPANPGAVANGQWVDISRPARVLQLVDPVVTLGAPFWVAYEALDTTSIPNTTWAANAAFQTGQQVLPSIAGAVGFYFTCSAAGTTGATEPDWPGAVGSTVVDGSVTWTCVAPACLAARSRGYGARRRRQHEPDGARHGLRCRVHGSRLRDAGELSLFPGHVHQVARHRLADDHGILPVLVVHAAAVVHRSVWALVVGLAYAAGGNQRARQDLPRRVPMGDRCGDHDDGDRRHGGSDDRRDPDGDGSDRHVHVPELALKNGAQQSSEITDVQLDGRVDYHSDRVGHARSESVAGAQWRPGWRVVYAKPDRHHWPRTQH